jgi:hypothetical protein
MRVAEDSDGRALVVEQRGLHHDQIEVPDGVLALIARTVARTDRPGHSVVLHLGLPLKIAMRRDSSTSEPGKHRLPVRSDRKPM